MIPTANTLPIKNQGFRLPDKPSYRIIDTSRRAARKLIIAQGIELATNTTGQE